MNQRDLIRLSLMLIVLGLNAILTHYAFEHSTGSPILNSVTFASYAVLVMAIVLLVQGCLCGRHAQRPKHPRLSVESVIVYVYGLGLLIFLTVYCVLGVSGDASAAFYVQLTCMALDDMFIRTKDGTLRRSVLLFCALLAGVANVCISISFDGAGESIQAILDLKWASILYGLVLPCLVPWVYFAVRGKRFYNPVTVYDFIHFGMPFAVIVSLMCLVGLDSAWYQDFSRHAPFNSTNETSERLVTKADVAGPLLCLNMLPTVFLAVQSILLYSTVDFISVAAVISSFRALAGQGASSLVVVGFVSACVSFAARIYACYRDESDKCSVVYARESEEDEEEDQMLEQIKADIAVLDA